MQANGKRVSEAASAGARLERQDWDALERSLWEWGWAKTSSLLAPSQCRELIRLFGDERRFRNRIDMARFRFGVGEYKYFAAPLPDLVGVLRARAYPPLAAIANRWEEALGRRVGYPGDLQGLLDLCAGRGQRKPTPLLLRYETGGYNCLHQDLYGEIAFPLQMTFLLSRPGADYTGGEFLLVEQRPRAQSRGEVIALEQGQAVIFATRYRPVRGSRGHFRAIVRHGVSRVLSGHRYSLGIIFHNAA
jgi:uncharacterized protein